MHPRNLRTRLGQAPQPPKVHSRTRTRVQDLVLRDAPVGDGHLQGHRLRHTGVPGPVAQGAHVRGVGGKDDAELAAGDGGGRAVVGGQGDDGQARDEDDPSVVEARARAVSGGGGRREGRKKKKKGGWLTARRVRCGGRRRRPRGSLRTSGSTCVRPTVSFWICHSRAQSTHAASAAAGYDREKEAE